MICDDLLKSCLVKQKRTDLNTIFTIQPVLGQYPGAKLSFSGTLIEHVSELLKNDPSYDLSECVKINISDGA